MMIKRSKKKWLTKKWLGKYMKNHLLTQPNNNNNKCCPPQLKTRQQYFFHVSVFKTCSKLKQKQIVQNCGGVQGSFYCYYIHLARIYGIFQICVELQVQHLALIKNQIQGQWWWLSWQSSCFLFQKPAVRIQSSAKKLY